MFLIYDFAVIGIAERIIAILQLNLSADFLYKPFFYAFMAKNVVRCHTGLSTVEILTEYNPFGSQFKLCGAVYNTRAFAAEFQDGRSQSFRRMSQDFFSYILTAGEKNKVEFLFKKAGIFLPAAGNDCNIFGRKTFRDYLSDNFTGGRGVSAGFDDCGITGCNRVCQRIYGKKKRIILRTHDQGVSIR